MLPLQVFAQGCVITRNFGPALGAQSSPCLDEGEYQLGVSYRWFETDEQFANGSAHSPTVTRLGTQVISSISLMQFSLAYALNDRWNLTLSVPYIIEGWVNRALPASVAGSQRFRHSSNGVGDIQAGARYWLFDCAESPDQNIALGIALKMPTGDSKVRDLFPNALGTDVRIRDVDSSIQPGDDGWGFALSLEWYKVINDFTVFLNAAYVFNPKGQNETFSAPAFLNPVGPSAVPANIRYVSVADSYIAKAGLAYPIAALPGLSVALAARIDGAPSEDVFGDETGFRHPGYIVTLEPSLNYATGKATFSLGFPTRVHQYVEDSLGSPRESTFADYLVEFNMSYRFGGD